MAEEKKRSGNSFFNYGRLKSLYTSGEESLESLAEKYGVPIVGLKRYCRVNLWDLSRMEYQKRLYEKLTEHRLEYAVLTKDAFDQKAGEMQMKAIDMLHNQMCALELNRDKTGDMDYEELNGILNQLQKLQQLSYRQLDVPLPKQQIETTIIKSPIKSIMDVINGIENDKLEKSSKEVN